MPELKLTVWGDTNVGLVRKNNEDYLSYFEPGDPQVIESMGRLYIVADGVGGAATGEVASKYAALKVLHTYFNQPALKPWQRIKAGMKHANIALVEYIRQNAQARMATTMVAAAINGNECTILFAISRCARSPRTTIW
jgi:protein phosphatase